MISARNRPPQSSGSSWSDLAHREIVDTFFKTKKDAHRHKSHRPAGHNPKKEKKPATVIIFALGLLLILFLAISAIIIILYLHRPSEKAVAAGEKIPHSEAIIENGVLNRSDIAKAYFDGDAKDSSFLKNSIRLLNTGPNGRASFVILFSENADLEGKSLLVTAKTERGAKRLCITLKDSMNRYAEFPDMVFSSGWALEHVYLEKKFSDFDFKRVKELKIEFGTHTAGNRQNSAVHIKDLVIRKRY